MRVKIILKKPAPNGMKEFDCTDHAIIDDKDDGYSVFSYGFISIGRKEQYEYSLKGSGHIVYNWDDIERLEITPDDG